MVQHEVVRLPQQAEIGETLQAAGVELSPMQQRKIGSAVQLLGGFNFNPQQAQHLSAEVERLAHPESAPMPLSNLPPMQQRAVNSALTLLRDDFQIAGQEAGALSHILNAAARTEQTPPAHLPHIAGGIPQIDLSQVETPRLELVEYEPVDTNAKQKKRIEAINQQRRINNGQAVDKYLDAVAAATRAQLGDEGADAIAMTLPVTAPNGQPVNVNLTNSAVQQMRALQALTGEGGPNPNLVVAAELIGVPEEDGSFKVSWLNVPGLGYKRNNYNLSFFDFQSYPPTVADGDFAVGSFLTHSWSDSPSSPHDWDMRVTTWRRSACEETAQANAVDAAAKGIPFWSPRVRRRARQEAASENAAAGIPWVTAFHDGEQPHFFGYNAEAFNAAYTAVDPKRAGVFAPLEEGALDAFRITPLPPVVAQQPPAPPGPGTVQQPPTVELNSIVPLTAGEKHQVVLAPLVEAAKPLVGVAPERHESGETVTYSLPAETYDALAALRGGFTQAFAEITPEMLNPNLEVPIQSDVPFDASFNQRRVLSDGTIVSYMRGTHSNYFNVQLDGRDSPPRYISVDSNGSANGPVYAYTDGNRADVEDEDVVRRVRAAVAGFNEGRIDDGSVRARLDVDSIPIEYSQAFRELSINNTLSVKRDDSIRYYNTEERKWYDIIRQEPTTQPPGPAPHLAPPGPAPHLAPPGPAPVYVGRHGEINIPQILGGEEHGEQNTRLIRQYLAEVAVNYRTQNPEIADNTALTFEVYHPGQQGITPPIRPRHPVEFTNSVKAQIDAINALAAANAVAPDVAELFVGLVGQQTEAGFRVTDVAVPARVWAEENRVRFQMAQGFGLAEGEVYLGTYHPHPANDEQWGVLSNQDLVAVNELFRMRGEQLPAQAELPFFTMIQTREGRQPVVYPYDINRFERFAETYAVTEGNATGPVNQLRPFAAEITVS
ncbi:Uncharacterised protein [uncultured archaeon]|nr:Uncharacterised protein [uncultured archaeon]